MFTDLISNSNGNITAAVIGVSGLVGVGQKDVAVPFKELKITSRNGKDWLVLNRTKEDLRSAPDELVDRSVANSVRRFQRRTGSPPTFIRPTSMITPETRSAMSQS
jgi:hypothetical protein